MVEKWKPHRSPTFCQRTWKIFRHCCCTSGWYPAVVAPIITTACVLSLYSSAGCDFIDLSVGFEPSNAIWNQSTANLGFFFYTEKNEALRTGISKYREIFHEGCLWYDYDFEEAIILRDRTWRAGRIIAMIAGSASLLALTAIWLLLLLPAPIGCIWPAILLPSTMLAFIAEGSKFLLFDVAICRNAMWFPSGVDSLPEVADNCALGSSSYFGIAAAILHFVSLLCVCLNAPEKRQLDPDFGVDDFDCDPEFLEQNSTEPVEFPSDPADGPHTFYSSDPSPSSTRIEGMNASIGSLTPDTTPSETGGYPAATRTPVMAASPSCPAESYPTKETKVENVPLPESNQHVSESRLAVISKMSLSTPSSEDMIAQLCSELDYSLSTSSISQNTKSN